jgi:hypothetical protein
MRSDIARFDRRTASAPGLVFENTDAGAPNLACDARSVTAAAPAEPSFIALTHAEAHLRSRRVSQHRTQSYSGLILLGSLREGDYALGHTRRVRS